MTSIGTMALTTRLNEEVKPANIGKVNLTLIRITRIDGWEKKNHEN